MKLASSAYNPALVTIGRASTSLLSHSSSSVTGIVAVSDSAGGGDVRDARERKWELDASLASTSPPPDWKRWTTAALEVEKYIHASTAAVADEPYYKSLETYMDRTHAPAHARQAIEFRHALARWNLPAAAALADSLAPSTLASEGWMAPDEVREGGIVAKLRVGDATGARRLGDGGARCDATGPCAAIAIAQLLHHRPYRNGKTARR
jgi:hypothetical protein